MAKTNDEEPTQAQQKEHMRRQAEAAKRHKESLKEAGATAEEFTKDTVPTPAEHVGKAEGETDAGPEPAKSGKKKSGKK